MLLKVSDIPPYEAFRLCCSDRRLQRELATKHRSKRLSAKAVPLTTKGDAPCEFQMPHRMVLLFQSAPA